MYQEIFIVAGQVLDREWDTDLEKRLMRAAKKTILESIDNASIFGNGKHKVILFNQNYIFKLSTYLLYVY